MEDASGRDLTQFTRWYSQAGTPNIHVKDSYDEAEGSYQLTLTQTCPDTPEANAADKEPFHIPVAIGLLGDAGNLAIHEQGHEIDAESSDNTHKVLELTEAQQTFVFDKLPEKPIPVLLRGFSAPVKLQYDYSREQLMAIMSREDDGFSRWDASQKLAVAVIHDAMAAYRAGNNYQVDNLLVEAYRAILLDDSLDPAMVALMLQLPSEAYLTEIAQTADVESIHHARHNVKVQLADALHDEFSDTYKRCNTGGDFSVSAEAVAERSLKNISLGYLVAGSSAEAQAQAQTQLANASNMTDEMAALAVLTNSEADGAEAVRDQALSDFFTRWQHEALVVNQWLVVQAGCQLPGGLERVIKLMQHEAFDIRNPNKVRSLIGAFCNGNAINFHRADGAGYEFLADQIITLNELNPQIAARQLTPLTKWKKYDEDRQDKMRLQLERILAEPTLSKDVYEVVSKSLKGK